jgi:hypothetical protein
MPQPEMDRLAVKTRGLSLCGLIWRPTPDWRSEILSVSTLDVDRWTRTGSGAFYRRCAGDVFAFPGIRL